MTFIQEQKKQGVIAASAGNHALALALHGRQLNVPVVVMMPEVAPLMKVHVCGGMLVAAYTVGWDEGVYEPEGCCIERFMSVCAMCSCISLKGLYYSVHNTLSLVL